LKEYTNKGQKYKCAFVRKVTSAKNREERTTFGYTYYYKPVEDYWGYIFFTDEAYIDPTSQPVREILREQGIRYNPENIQERKEKIGVKFHIATWVTWFDKAEKLVFYNDEEEETIQPPIPPRPRRRPITETPADYDVRLKEWEALRPHPVDVKPSGNSITQKYYTEHLLPVYIEAVYKVRARDQGPWRLQEDGDPLHDIRKEGLARRLKDSNWIENHILPAQSPDLNPIEACWNILKQRIRRRIFYSEEDMKEALQEEWAKITMTEVRKRISQIPSRCR
jgi:hypothetical protein